MITRKGEALEVTKDDLTKLSYDNSCCVACCHLICSLKIVSIQNLKINSATFPRPVVFLCYNTKTNAAACVLLVKHY